MGITRLQGRGKSSSPAPAAPGSLAPLSRSGQRQKMGSVSPSAGRPVMEPWQAQFYPFCSPLRAASRQGRGKQAQGNGNAGAEPWRRARVGVPGCSGFLGSAASQLFPLLCYRWEGEPRGLPCTKCHTSLPSLGVDRACTPSTHLWAGAGVGECLCLQRSLSECQLCPWPHLQAPPTFPSLAPSRPSVQVLLLCVLGRQTPQCSGLCDATQP